MLTKTDLNSIASVLQKAEAYLSESYGTSGQFVDFELLSERDHRNLVLRCQFKLDSEAVTSSVILKKAIPEVNVDAASIALSQQRFYGGWAGAAFLDLVGLENGRSHCPKILMGDSEMGFILIEDLGSNLLTLSDTLRGTNSTLAYHHLIGYAQRLGQIQADSLGQLSKFQNLLHSIFEKSDVFLRGFDNLSFFMTFLQEKLATSYDLDVETEVETIVNAILSPGTLTAYLQGDPCPINACVINDEIKLIDFEFGQFGHAFVDIACSRMSFPTCGFAHKIPRKIVEDMEAAYRAQILQKNSIFINDKTFDHNLTLACAYWLINTIGYHLPNVIENDEMWGNVSVRSRILTRIDEFIFISQERNCFKNLSRIISKLREYLLEMWPGTALLALYPAFADQ